MNQAASRRSEVFRVTDILRSQIIDGERRPGSRLVERELAEHFGVSRVPIREALKQLSVEGLVTARPNTWSIVRDFSSSDIADFNEVRNAIETVAFELAAIRHTRTGLAELEQIMLRGKDRAQAGDVTGARRTATEFHSKAVELSANKLLIEINEQLDSRMRWLLSRHDDLEQVAVEHAQLFDAIARRDIGRVRHLTQRHLETSREQQDLHSRSNSRTLTN
ncbi:GntR family transcriptional regulator [Brevibacterium siliguriense]|uniref:GntR family transcriptional regulator n=1 Tax=Brevibacterium siliguriense TaxID=1136497 RepID=UPI0014289E42|nr:GntR family transcriptional regulator [Brevibacterium siliguriense]